MEKTIYEKLNEELKVAMRFKDERRKNHIRSIKAKATEYEVANNLDRNATLDDKTMMEIIASHKKSLEKAIKQLDRGGDSSLPLINEYQDEIFFCDRFLPSVEDEMNNIEVIVDNAINTVGDHIGKVVGYVMKNNKSLNGALVKKVVMGKLQ